MHRVDQRLVDVAPYRRLVEGERRPLSVLRVASKSFPLLRHYLDSLSCDWLAIYLQTYQGRHVISTDVLTLIAGEHEWKDAKPVDKDFALNHLRVYLRLRRTNEVSSSRRWAQNARHQARESR